MASGWGDGRRRGVEERRGGGRSAGRRWDSLALITHRLSRLSPIVFRWGIGFVGPEAKPSVGGF